VNMYEGPPPLRAGFSTDLDFRTTQTPMQGGYIVQRRWEPYIFRQLTLDFRMSVEEFTGWWRWTHRYAYGWHEASIQGEVRVLRYISDVSFQYVDYATVEASVRAEERLSETLEEWDGVAPDDYDPGFNEDLAPDNTGGATIDLDLTETVGVYPVSLDPSSPLDVIIQTTNKVAAFTTLSIATDDPIVMEIYDIGDTTMLAKSKARILSWHHNSATQNLGLRLDPATAYILRLTTLVSAANYNLYAYTEI